MRCFTAHWFTGSHSKRSLRPRWRIIGLAGMLLAPLGLAAAQTPAAAAFGTTWAMETPPPGADLRGVDCTATSTCVAVGVGGTILRSTGTGWNQESSMTSQALFGVSCSDANSCVAVGAGGTIVRRTGSTTWSSPISPPGVTLYGVSCMPAVPSARCIAVGESADYFSHPGVDPYLEPVTIPMATILVSTDAGATWARQVAPDTQGLADVDCSTALTCVATGYASAFLTTVDGGTTWARGVRVLPISTPSSNPGLVTWDVFGVSCPSVMTCVSVDNGGFLLQTLSAGAVWTAPVPGGLSTSSMNAVDCSTPTPTLTPTPNLTTCFAVGYLGKIYSTTNLGATWAAGSSGTTDLYGVSCTANACWAVGDGGLILRNP